MDKTKLKFHLFNSVDKNINLYKYPQSSISDLIFRGYFFFSFLLTEYSRTSLVKKLVITLHI